MINLKLAEYKDGKFEMFLELGKDFLFGGDSIIVSGCSVEELIEYMDPIFKKDYFKRDEKDPLNRFNGLFDGRTYGEGRFVLIEVVKNKYYGGVFSSYLTGQSPPYFEDDIVEGWRAEDTEWNFNRTTEELKKRGYFIGNAFDCQDEIITAVRDSGDFKRIGNLHENPELYDKMK